MTNSTMTVLPFDASHHLRIIPDSSWFQVWSGDRHVATFYDEADANDFVAGHVLSKLVLLKEWKEKP
jgi:hypothetical protein